MLSRAKIVQGRENTLSLCKPRECRAAGESSVNVELNKYSGSNKVHQL